MNLKIAALVLAVISFAGATTISVVPIYEPITLHGTDVDEAISEIGEALQATVMPRPMALSGAFPETLVEAVRTTHELPGNDPNYTVDEVNLLVLCRVGVAAEIVDQKLEVSLDVGEMVVPEGIDLTERQVIRLAIVAIRKTLEVYQEPQPDRLEVKIAIVGAGDQREGLGELACHFEIEGS
ncbi:hypothetical protein [Haloferula sp. A504]|uniref:hypothetical protein n=1 Tax=Haloferula sp. A504 TaxID=3373601 RepID=UPI0031BCC854|nr:hypothetical protein [Verrucomicrobiaceae bacterium E54]